MAANHSSSTLNALWKKVYAGKIESLIPDFVKATKKYKFEQGKKIGDEYVQPVIVHRSHGFTRGRGLQTLNAAIVHQTAQAKLNPMPIYLREIIPYDVAARMTESGEASFILHSKQLVQQMLESAHYRNELEFFYGQDSLGTAESSANSSSTKTVVTISAASWGPGIWAGAENAKVKFTKVSDDSLVSSGADAIFTITAIDPDDRKLTVEGTSTGISALDIAIGAGDCDVVWLDSMASAKGDQENAGLKKILTNTGSLFGIDAGTYSMWRGNSYSASNADLTMRKILASAAKAVGRGLSEDADVWVPSRAFENLNVDQADLRRYNLRESKAEAGANELCFYGSNGKLSVIPHPMLKEGDFFVVPPKRVVRTGSTDVTFNLPGKADGEIFLHKDEQNGYELRCMAEVGQMLTAPARAVYGKDVVNS